MPTGSRSNLSELATAAREPRRRSRLTRAIGSFRTPWSAVTAVFFAHGFVFASWTAHIPHVKEQLALNDGALGIALLGTPIGSIAAMVIAARLLPRLGSRPIVKVTLTGYCVAGPFLGLARSEAALFIALMAWGAFQGTLDVSMNTQAIAVERRAGRTFMPGFHGSWSVGSFAGAAAGAAGVAIGLSLSTQLLMLGAPCLLIAGWLTIRMLPDARPRPDESPDRVHQRLPRAAWLAIGLLSAIAAADFLCEGAVADWAAVYLRTSLGAAPAIAALGFTIYLLTMVIVRLSGNWLLARFRAGKLLPVLTGTAAALFGAALAASQVALMLIGFAGLGIGIAVVVPVVFSAAGRVGGMNAGTAVSVVSSSGWAGLVCGPVLIGQVASVTSLRIALVLIPVLTALIAVSTATSRALR
ncbi:MAG TPA: MFS transporter [Streptosporangiaceae bacterium]|nr:MFS transporter [Streptosporangiaceae bacterium]